MLRMLLITLLTTLTQSSFGSLGPCPKNTYGDHGNLNAVNYLHDLEGHFSLGSCSIEIQVCDSSITAS